MKVRHFFVFCFIGLVLVLMHCGSGFGKSTDNGKNSVFIEP